MEPPSQSQRWCPLVCKETWIIWWSQRKFDGYWCQQIPWLGSQTSEPCSILQTIATCQARVSVTVLRPLHILLQFCNGAFLTQGPLRGGTWWLMRDLNPFWDILTLTTTWAYLDYWTTVGMPWPGVLLWKFRVLTLKMGTCETRVHEYVITWWPAPGCHFQRNFTYTK